MTQHALDVKDLGDKQQIQKAKMEHLEMAEKKHDKQITQLKK